MVVYLSVPFAQNDKARKAGALWSPGHKKWYVKDAKDLTPFLSWIDKSLLKPHKPTNYEKNSTKGR